MLCTVTLPVALTTPLSIEGMAALPGGYPNRPYSGTLSATGGLQPIVWTSTSPAPDGLTWAPSDEGLNFTLSGTLGALPTGQTVPVSISAQSDPSTAVSSLKTAQGNLLVSDPPAEPTDYARIGWIAGGTIASGLLSAFVVWRIVKRVNEKKLDTSEQSEADGLLTEQKALGIAIGESTEQIADKLKEQAQRSPQTDLAKLASSISQNTELMAELQSKMDALDSQIKKAREEGNSDVEDRLSDEWFSLGEERDGVARETKDLVEQHDASKALIRD
ncbi:MAG: hypothetical protein EON54_05725 [Alcaligenaceae bacterium]|nr:MAG: hypothetical protein EON54_05725 [Alcaligenaceae bacterium]